MGLVTMGFGRNILRKNIHHLALNVHFHKACLFLIIVRMSKTSVFAPARVNIIGEHTDHNRGFVLPTTTALYTRVDAAQRTDRIVEVISRYYGETQSFSLDDLAPADHVTWIEYVKGVAAELQAVGVRLRGATIAIDGDIPVGGGLSSSASLELAVATALLKVADESVPAQRLAEICQRAEHNYAGVQCGIMDQYTIACAEKGNAILLDCRSLDVVQVPILDSARFILTDSGVRHRLPDGHYNNRTDECAAAVSALATVVPDLESLRDLDAKTLEIQKKNLGDVLYRRCRHVLTENARVQDAAVALRQGDLAHLGSLLSACHESLRDDFEVSCEELEVLVGIANASPGVLGSRMVGAGFGGCVLSLTSANDAEEAARQISSNYTAEFGTEPWMHIVQASHPVREVANR
jgi:galactokinase